MKQNGGDVPSTTQFVLGEEIVEIGSYHALKTRSTQGKYRLFAEMLADPDRVDLQTSQFYQEILSALPPGGIVRFMLINWLDPLPREEFIKQYNQYAQSKTENDTLNWLAQSLEQHLLEYPLPFIQRSIVEFAFNGRQEELTWWDTLPAIAEKYGIGFVYLEANDLLKLSKGLFFSSVLVE